VKAITDRTLRLVETWKLSAIFVALGLEPLALVCVPLAVDVLLLAAEPLVAVLLLLVAVDWLALGVPRMPPWAVAGTL
jgi:hypothetical protein